MGKCAAKAVDIDGEGVRTCDVYIWILAFHTRPVLPAGETRD